MRVPGEHISLDIFCCYQYVWTSKETLDTNKTLGKQFLASLRCDTAKEHPASAWGLQHVSPYRHEACGPCTIQSCRLGHGGSKDLQGLLEEHQLVAANTWGVKRPATHTQGNSVTLIDYAFIRIMQSKGPGKMSQPQRSFPVAQWRNGSRHFPLLGTVQHSRSYSARWLSSLH